MTAIPLEKAVQEWVRSAAEERGARTVKLHGEMMQERGLPDLYVGHRYFNGWIEVKRQSTARIDNQMTAHQKAFCRDMEARRIPALVIRQAQHGHRVVEAWRWRPLHGRWELAFTSAVSGLWDQLVAEMALRATALEW